MGETKIKELEITIAKSPFVIDELHENVSAASLIIFGMDGVSEEHYTWNKEDEKLYSSKNQTKEVEGE